MAGTQKAYVLPVKLGRQEIKEIAIPDINDDEVLVKVESAALNPVDYKIVEYGIIVETFPTVLGLDGAGVVQKVGRKVSRFKVGDRVLFNGKVADMRTCTFQQYAVTAEQAAAKFPDSLSFDQAATLPVATITSAVALFKSLTITPPWEGARTDGGEFFLVAGGSSSVGQLSIQFANILGFTVIATSSPHNHELLRSFGASYVFNYRDADVVDKIKGVAGDELLYAIDTTGASSAQLAWDALSSTKPAYLATIAGVPDAETNPDKYPKKDVSVRPAFGSSYANPEVSVNLWPAFEKLLVQDKIKPNKVEYLEGGLAAIARGQELQKAGKVSAVKLVIRPPETA